MAERETFKCEWVVFLGHDEDGEVYGPCGASAEMFPDGSWRCVGGHAHVAYETWARSGMERDEAMHEARGFDFPVEDESRGYLARKHGEFDPDAVIEAYERSEARRETDEARAGALGILTDRHLAGEITLDALMRAEEKISDEAPFDRDFPRDDDLPF